MSALDLLLEGFAAAQPEAFPGQDFTVGDRVRVSVRGGKSVVGQVRRPHGSPPSHAIVAPEGGGAHVKAPVGDVKLDTPARHALERKRAAADAVRQAQQAPGPGRPPVLGKPPPHPVSEGVSMLVEAFAPPPPPSSAETPAQSQAIGASQVAGAQKALAAGWNPAKHPRGGGGKFGYTTGGKRATRGTAGSRTLGQGSRGAMVRSIQHQLNIPADGTYGPQTHAAVARYQRQHGLQVDGVVGRQTLASLRGSVNARLVAPGPISSRQATVKTHPAARALPPVAPPAPMRVGGGVVV